MVKFKKKNAQTVNYDFFKCKLKFLKCKKSKANWLGEIQPIVISFRILCLALQSSKIDYRFLKNFEVQFLIKFSTKSKNIKKAYHSCYFFE